MLIYSITNAQEDVEGTLRRVFDGYFIKLEADVSLDWIVFFLSEL